MKNLFASKTYFKMSQFLYDEDFALSLNIISLL